MKPRLSFLLAAACATLGDRLQGRALAVNDDAVFTPYESSRGTESLDANEAVFFRNAVVCVLPTDDRIFGLPSSVNSIPRGILLNDEVPEGEVGAVRKAVAIFGLYPDTLPAVASGPIAVDAELMADPDNPGYVRALPTAAGTYLVFGRSRFKTLALGDPVSIVHCVPRRVVVP